MYRVEEKETGRQFALKSLPKDSYDLYLLEREVLIMKDLAHESLVQLHAAFQDKQRIYLVLDLVEGGELFDLIIAKEFFAERDAGRIVRQLLSAIEYMHERGCAHRDIKAENVLCVDAHASQVKLADFGLANALGDATKFQSCVGTTDYMAPEMLEGVRYSFEVDMWSIGVLTFILLCGYPPFYGRTEAARVDLILSGRYSFDDEVWHSVSDAAKHFISHLLVPQPHARYSARQALAHPWITGDASGAAEADRALPSMAGALASYVGGREKERGKGEGGGEGGAETKEERRARRRAARAVKEEKREKREKREKKEKREKERERGGEKEKEKEREREKREKKEKKEKKEKR